MVPKVQSGVILVHHPLNVKISDVVLSTLEASLDTTVNLGFGICCFHLRIVVHVVMNAIVHVSPLFQLMLHRTCNQFARIDIEVGSRASAGTFNALVLSL